MRSHWMIAALLSFVVAAGCNGRSNDNAQNYDQNQAAAPANAPTATDQAVAPVFALIAYSEIIPPTLPTTYS